jgi:hypothetical protein
MIDYRIDDLEVLLVKLRADGVDVADERYEDENGRFAWITDTRVTASSSGYLRESLAERDARGEREDDQ